MHRTVVVLGLALIATWAIAPPVLASEATTSTWSVVGQEALGPRHQSVIIPVSRGTGVIERLQIEMTHGRGYIEAVTVIYETGAIERLLVGGEFKPGSRSALYELGAAGRRVESVEIAGQAISGRALMRLWADAGRPEPSAFSRFEPHYRLSAARRVVVLDRRTIDPRLDQHLFHPGDGHAAADAFRLRVRGGAVHVRRLFAVTHDNRSSAIDVDRLLRDGEATPTVPVRADIREILVLVTPSRASRPTTLELEGLSVMGGGPAAPPPGWLLLGEGSGLDRDIIEIGPEAGSFRAIALNVAGGSVTLGRLIFVYADGRRDIYPVDKEIPDGTFTPGVPLKGDGRLQRIELHYVQGDPGAIVEIFAQPPS